MSAAHVNSTKLSIWKSGGLWISSYFHHYMKITIKGYMPYHDPNNNH